MTVVTDAAGKDTIFVAGQKHHFTPPTFELVPPPGHLKEMMKSHGEGTAASFLKPMRPEYQQRSARLAVMDEQGVESILLFPTFGVTVEHALRGDAEATFAAVSAFNRWLEEDWGFGADGRIFGVPLLSLVDVDLAVAELERVLARGARMVHLLAGPVNGTQPGRSALRPRLVAARRGARAGRLPRRRVGLQRARLDAVGAPRAPALAPPERLAERLLLHRGADHAHARRPDLRQPVRALPEPEGRDDRVRERAGCRTCCRASTRRR